jgi:hypothetical protein
LPKEIEGKEKYDKKRRSYSVYCSLAARLLVYLLPAFTVVKQRGRHAVSQYPFRGN